MHCPRYQNRLISGRILEEYRTVMSSGICRKAWKLPLFQMWRLSPIMSRNTAVFIFNSGKPGKKLS